MRAAGSESPTHDRRTGRWLVAALLAGLAGAFGPAATGWAAVPCGVNGVLSTAGATSSCTYTGEGEDSFTVPAGVDSLQVVAIGGKGGGPLGGQAGGFGARVSAQVPSQGGAVLHVEVAGNGGDSSFPGGSAFPTVGGVGGAGGGARGGSAILGAVAFGGGGGGGATDLRTAPLSAGLSPDPRLLVAGGGGGSAQSGTAGDGAGGAAGSAGAANGSGFGAGQPGTSTGGGSGGPGQPAQPGIVGPGGTGQDGGRGTGGAGGAGALQGDNIVSTGDGGGGGGGGYFGGGGGGGGGAQATADGGGGGGGSSFVSAGASDPVLAADTTGVPSMTISFPALRASDTTLTCTSVAVGQTSTCTAAVGDADSGTTVIPTGRVNFTSNSPGTFDAGSCLLASDGGRASCTVGYTPVRAASGSHEITASYDGDAAHGPSSAVAGVTIMTVTSTALLTSGNPAVAGDVVSYSVVVAPAPDRGTVLFVDNGTPIPNCGAVVLQPGSGAASCSLRYAATGSHNIQARYSGSGLYQESFSAQLIEVIRAAGSPPPTSTSTSVSSSQNPSQTGQTTTLTATVTPRPDDGTVQFYTTGGVAIQGCDDVPIQGQQASCKVMLVSAGSFDLRASYSGDAAFASSISPALSQAVKAPVTPTGQPIVINTGVSLTLTTSPTQANWDVSLALVDRIPPRPTGPNSPVQAASHMRRATAPAVRAKRGRRAHTIGIRTVNVRGGKKVTLSVKLNKLGRRLLAKRGALHVYLTVTLIFRGHRTVLETKKVTLR